jgi:hypothetical protein
VFEVERYIRYVLVITKRSEERGREREEETTKCVLVIIKRSEDKGREWEEETKRSRRKRGSS